MSVDKLLEQSLLIDAQGGKIIFLGLILWAFRAQRGRPKRPEAAAVVMPGNKRLGHSLQMVLLMGTMHIATIINCPLE